MIKHKDNMESKLKVQIALDHFLGKDAPTIAAERDTSIDAINQAVRQYAEQQEEILECYFTNKKDREAVVKTFDRPVDLVELVEALEARVAQLEREREPLPALSIGSQAPRSQPSQINRQNYDLGGEDIRSNTKIHVTHQVAERWVQLFGDKSAYRDGPADFEAIRKRIIAFYFNGSLAAKGAIHTITGAEKYSAEMARMTAVLSADAMTISKIEKIDWSEV
jgi:hypothetical protein